MRAKQLKALGPCPICHHAWTEHVDPEGCSECMYEAEHEDVPTETLLCKALDPAHRDVLAKQAERLLAGEMNEREFDWLHGAVDHGGREDLQDLVEMCCVNGLDGTAKINHWFDASAGAMAQRTYVREAARHLADRESVPAFEE